MFATHRTDRQDAHAGATATPDIGPPLYCGPDRRSRNNWLTTAFNEIDFGILLLSAGAEVYYANRAALSELVGQHPLRVADHRICARDPRDANRLNGALQDAALRGFRKLLVLGTGNDATIAVVPLACPRVLGGANVMLMLSRRDFAAPLAVEAFARSQDLTAAETRVLLALCNGKTPQEIAREANVEISTVRSQIVSIRHKTGARDLRALVTQVAALPPFMGILGHMFGLPLFNEQDSANSHPALQGA